MSYTALVMAAKRQGVIDPLAEKAGTTHKCLIDMDGVPMIERVITSMVYAKDIDHIIISIDEPEVLMGTIRHAGSVFLGRMTPEAVGDYVAGPNHVLPTGRRARFSSGLSVLDFMKRTSFISLDEAALGKIGPAAAHLAHAEGLPAHAKSVELRLK